MIIPSTNGDDIARYATDLGHKWKIGQKGKDNGIVFLIAKDDRRMTIQAGYGTEHLLTDALSKRIIEQVVKPEFKNNYSVTDLRTLQDWVVKRQLSGIKGVVEINTWGGYLKQYEVAVNSATLKAMNVTITDLFSALEKNNSITGGGYIEKENESYFIRGEGRKIIDGRRGEYFGRIPKNYCGK